MIKYLLRNRIGLLAIIGLIILIGCEKKSEEVPPSVIENINPICVFIDPMDGSVLELTDFINLSVEVSDIDGEIDKVEFYIDNIGMGQVNTFPYLYKWQTTVSDTGIHIVRAVATDNDGGRAESSVEFAIEIKEVGRVPIAEFFAETTLIGSGLDLQFADYSEFEPTSWLWSFGDGSTSSQQNPIKRYSEDGNYTVSLTVVNEFGSDIETKVDYITVGLYNTYTDPRDGNVYDIIEIGNQTWFAENLRTHESGHSWSTSYGRLYEWGFGHNVIPEGWHIPSRSEWQQLISSLGGENVAGGKMKESGADSWDAPNIGATNESFFAARGGGYRDYEPTGYYNEGKEVRYWIDEGGEPWVSYIALYNDQSNVSYGTMHTWGGCYYRLVKD